MATLNINYVRDVYFDNGVQTFRIRATCDAKGDLPDTGIFLMQITNSRDSLEDVFTRIVNVADIETYTNNRDTAIAAGDIYWRSNELEKNYTDIDVAVSAVAAINDRVNSTVSAYSTYTDDFETASEDSTFPSTDPSTLDALKTTYSTKYAAYETALADQTEAAAAKTDADNDLTDAEDSLEEWTDFQTDLQQNLDEMTSCKNNFESLVSTSQVFVQQADLLTDAYAAQIDDLRMTARLLKLVATGYSSMSQSDIGKIVTDGTSSGRLMAYNNTTRQWIVVPDNPIGDNLFNAAAPVTVGGSAAGTLQSASTLWADDEPILEDEEATFSTARDSFESDRVDAVSEVSEAAEGVTHHQNVVNNLTSIISQKTTARNTARDAVSSAEVALQTANGNLEQAYDELETAYNNVKTVCPTWSPDSDESFPPTP